MCLERLFLKVLSEEDSLIPGGSVFEYSPVLNKKEDE